jgi:hypothetical protein
MAENHEDPLGGDPRTPANPAGDRDIHAGRVLAFCAGLALLLVVSVGVCLLIYTVFNKRHIAMDPAPSPLPEANAPVMPPEPRLQESPIRDMAALRARESAVLSGYGWTDKGAGIGRIPIERAMDLALEPGLRPARIGGAESAPSTPTGSGAGRGADGSGSGSGGPGGGADGGASGGADGGADGGAP